MNFLLCASAVVVIVLVLRSINKPRDPNESPDDYDSSQW